MSQFLNARAFSFAQFRKNIVYEFSSILKFQCSNPTENKVMIFINLNPTWENRCGYKTIEIRVCGLNHART